MEDEMSADYCLISKTLNSLTAASYFNSASHFISPHPWRLMSPLISKAFIGVPS